MSTKVFNLLHDTPAPLGLTVRFGYFEPVGVAWAQDLVPVKERKDFTTSGIASWGEVKLSDEVEVGLAALVQGF